MKTLMRTAATVLALTSAGEASAATEYGVATAAQSWDSAVTGGASVSAYRTTTDAAGRYTLVGDGFWSRGDNCAFLNANTPGLCGASQSGTPDNSPQNLTSASSGVTLSIGALNMSGGAASDLSTGGLKAFAVGDHRLCNGFVCGPSSQAFAQFNDTLSFTVAGATPGSFTDIGVSFTLDGSLFAGNGLSLASVGNSLAFGDAFARIFYQDTHSPTVFSLAHQGGWQSFNWSAPNPALTTFTGIYRLSGVSQSLGIDMRLNVEAGGNAFAQYFNTSRFSLTLPQNVTFTSASGVFLKGLGGPSGVPEPASWAMMIAGFGFVGGAMRRRQNTVSVTYA